MWPGGQHEAVAAGPVGVGRVVPHHLLEEQCTRPAPGSSPCRDGRCRPSARRRRPGRGRCPRPAGPVRSTRGLWWSAWCSPWVRAPLHMSRMSKAPVHVVPTGRCRAYRRADVHFFESFQTAGTSADPPPDGVVTASATEYGAARTSAQRAPAGTSARRRPTRPTPAKAGYAQRLQWRGTREPLPARSHAGGLAGMSSVRGVRDGRRIPSRGGHRDEPEPEATGRSGPVSRRSWR